MRVKEWYGWHFPEMTKIITDNIAYAKVVLLMGNFLPLSVLYISRYLLTYIQLPYLQACVQRQATLILVAFYLKKLNPNCVRLRCCPWGQR